MIRVCVQQCKLVVDFMSQDTWATTMIGHKQTKKWLVLRVMGTSVTGAISTTGRHLLVSKAFIHGQVHIVRQSDLHRPAAADSRPVDVHKTDASDDVHPCWSILDQFSGFSCSDQLSVHRRSRSALLYLSLSALVEKDEDMDFSGDHPRIPSLFYTRSCASSRPMLRVYPGVW